jgi:hypothetical protein
MSVVSAPPRKDIWLVWGQYGMVGGARVHPRSRLWLLTDEPTVADGNLTCRIAWNHPVSGYPEYEDLGPVRSARVHGSKSAEVYLESGEMITFNVAPCVCGAGAVGQAAPEEGRISLQYVTTSGRSRLTMLP